MTLWTGLTRAVAILSLLACTGCQGPGVTPENAEAFTRQFAAGQVELDRDNPIALPSPWYRRRVHSHWQSQRWPELAADVAENGYDMDLNWFYLGEAARNQGFAQAAQYYYRRAYKDAISSDMTRRCSFFLDVSPDACSWFPFPQAIIARARQ